ncbi:cryptochrome/deoxyribodipyrimidine photo-lyase family protein [Gemmatimonas groenlandica]|uniref:Deoxyribodipyrimidine photo-lyase/cryptochrome family protein n=1 Tax=Gemmatimonas groenlandica TaxID=2732249 RepID=A0A6M4IK07_9BACT|nr:cryptochrome/deoxyribodipyrimidine photo-lyase family protein [Gemmatimonas groenlandica]QJR35404.1 deoxyribodipyrimidine photo-lyase/cryptochrome family protein [Gemmatimonas groenlandica]
MAALQLVWYKRDLRIADHAPLAGAMAAGPVVAVYVHEPEQQYATDRDVRHERVLRDALDELKASWQARGGHFIELHGVLPAVFDALHRVLPFAAIWAHEETWNALSYARDRRVRAWAKHAGVTMHELPSNGVVRRLASRDGWAETWQRRMRSRLVPAPDRIASPDAATTTAAVTALPEDMRTSTGAHVVPPWSDWQRGGEARGHDMLLSFLSARGQDYRRAMSSPNEAPEACSRISVALAFGSLSVRHAYQAARQRARELRDDTRNRRDGDAAQWSQSLVSFASRLHWHCHFIQKLEDEPRLETTHYAPVFDGLRPAEPDMDHLRAWRDGQTGYPLVDACMRSLRVTGWLTFRMRAMVMSFASYHLWLDWRHTGPVLARWFTDYEPGIHWTQCQMQSGTTGINTIRIYNPYKQAEEHDAAGAFVRRWVPELSALSDADLVRPEHTPLIMQQMTGCVIGRDYPLPIVHHETAYAFARDRMHAIKQAAQRSGSAQQVYDRHGSRRTPLEARTR